MGVDISCLTFILPFVFLFKLQHFFFFGVCFTAK